MSIALSTDKSSSTLQRKESNKELLHYAETKRDKGSFNDVIIKTGGQSIPANKMVLSCYSKFFEAMFESNMKETHENEVEINGFDGCIIKVLIDYIYTGTIIIDPKCVMNILAASDYLRLDAVKEFCFQYLESELTAENCLNIIRASILYKTNASLAQAYALLSENLEEISQTENFKKLSSSHITAIVNELDKNETNETAKYHAVVNWVKSEYGTRSKDFPCLFHSIDVSKLPLAFLEDVVATESLVRENPACLNAVLACTFSLLKNLKLRGTEPKILCVGGNEKGDVFELSIIFGQVTKVYPNLPLNVSGHCAAKVNNFIYCIGGETKEFIDTKRVFRLNLNKDASIWKEVASLNKARSYFGCDILNDKIVVAGVCRNPDSTELYDERSNTWKMLSVLNESRYGNALVACEGRLYAIGGWGESSAEFLSDFDAKWVKVEPMKTPRERYAAVSCGKFIYAIGGHSGKTEKSVEKYYPHDNKWVAVKPMNVERWGHAACVVQDKIFVIGGMNAENKPAFEIECYNTTNDTWRIVGETDIELYGHALIVV